MTAEHVGGPHKIVLDTYRSHETAQHTVDVLAEHRFPVEHVTIVGNGLRIEEQVLGRWTFGRALLAGAGSGAWIGLLIGLVFWIVSPWAAGAVISAIILGALFGAVFAAITQVVRRQAFASSRAVVADRYDILVDADFAEEARRTLTAVVTPETSR